MRRHDRWALPTEAGQRAALNRVHAEKILGRHGFAAPADLAPHHYLTERTRLWEGAFDRNMEREFEFDRIIDPLPEHWSPGQAPAFTVLLDAAQGWKGLQRAAEVALGVAVVTTGLAFMLEWGTPLLPFVTLGVVLLLLCVLGLVRWRVHVEENRALLRWGASSPGRIARGIPGWARDAAWASEATLLAFAGSLVLVVGALANLLYRVVTWVVGQFAEGSGQFPLGSVIGFVAAWGLHRLVAAAGRRVHVASSLRDDAFRWLGWVDEEDESDDHTDDW